MRARDRAESSREQDSDYRLGRDHKSGSLLDPWHGQGAEISDMTIAANPNRRTRRYPTGAPIQPLVELHGASSNIGMGRSRHFEVEFPHSVYLPLGRSGAELRHCCGALEGYSQRMISG